MRPQVASTVNATASSACGSSPQAPALPQAAICSSAGACMRPQPNSNRAITGAPASKAAALAQASVQAMTRALRTARASACASLPSAWACAIAGKASAATNCMASTIGNSTSFQAELNVAKAPSPAPEASVRATKGSVSGRPAPRAAQSQTRQPGSGAGATGIAGIAGAAGASEAGGCAPPPRAPQPPPRPQQPQDHGKQQKGAQPGPVSHARPRPAEQEQGRNQHAVDEQVGAVQADDIALRLQTRHQQRAQWHLRDADAGGEPSRRPQQSPGHPVLRCLLLRRRLLRPIAPPPTTPASQSGRVSITMTTSAMPELPKAAARVVSRSTPSARLASSSSSDSRPALKNMRQIIEAQTKRGGKKLKSPIAPRNRNKSPECLRTPLPAGGLSCLTTIHLPTPPRTKTSSLPSAVKSCMRCAPRKPKAAALPFRTISNPRTRPRSCIWPMQRPRRRRCKPLPSASAWPAA